MKSLVIFMVELLTLEIDDIHLQRFIEVSRLNKFSLFGTVISSFSGHPPTCSQLMVAFIHFDAGAIVSFKPIHLISGHMVNFDILAPTINE